MPAPSKYSVPFLHHKVIEEHAEMLLGEWALEHPAIREPPVPIEDILELGTDISAIGRAQSLAVLGDWAMSYGRLERGLTRYRNAYAILAAGDAAAATALFSSPALINFIPPPSPVDRAKGINAYAWGTVSAVFEITADGRARNVEIVSATPPGLMDARYRRRLMESYFRPRLVAGEPAATRQVGARTRPDIGHEAGGGRLILRFAVPL